MRRACSSLLTGHLLDRRSGLSEAVSRSDAVPSPAQAGSPPLSLHAYRGHTYRDAHHINCAGCRVTIAMGASYESAVRSAAEGQANTPPQELPSSHAGSVD